MKAYLDTLLTLSWELLSLYRFLSVVTEVFWRRQAWAFEDLPRASVI